ncbi:P-loop containing nucleoside triphosphate hydrolase protein [Trichoderma barbatum]
MNFISTLARRLAIGARPLSRIVKLPIHAPGIYNSCRPFASSHRLLGKQTMKSPFTPSLEQQRVVNLCVENNVVVSARPGSGKTATAEAIVAAYPYLRIATITYSKALQLETYRRFKKYSNGEAFTMHKVARLLFGVVVPDDVTLLQQIKQVVRCNELPQGDFQSFDIIVLDEFQDCTELLFWLITCFIRVNTQKRGGQPARLVILGDERQSIYRFRGANQRYLTIAHELLGPISSYPFVDLPLSQSFRLSDQTTQFINKTFLGGDSYITSSKSGPKPIVLRCNRSRSNSLAKKLSLLISQYGAENTAILAPYVRKNKALGKLANVLAEKYHVPIAEPIDDDSPLDERTVDGKLCISTIHQFKGRERDLVILLDMESSFFDFFGRDLPDDTCPNEIFVALTRAVEQLVLVHDDRKKLMPFVSVDALYETADVVNMTSKKDKIASPNAPGRALQFGLVLPDKVRVTEMSRHVRGEFLDEIVQRELCIQDLSSEKGAIEIPDVVSSDPKRGFYEAVRDVNGLVIVAAFQHAITGTVTMLDSNNEDAHEKCPVCPDEQISWLCQKACKYQAEISGYRPRQLQLKNAINWIEPKKLELARNRLQGSLDDSATNLKFGVTVKQLIVIDNEQTCLHGRADVVSIPTPSDSSDVENVESVWEIKFVSQFSNEHIVQASAYAYLLASQFGRIPRTILFNVRDGKKLEIIPRNGLEGLRRMIEDILRLKYTAVEEMEDESFIEMCAKTTREVLNLDASEQ